jgi:hypothetical protein
VQRCPLPMVGPCAPPACMPALPVQQSVQPGWQLPLPQCCPAPISTACRSLLLPRRNKGCLKLGFGLVHDLRAIAAALGGEGGGCIAGGCGGSNRQTDRQTDRQAGRQARLGMQPGGLPVDACCH